MYFLCSFALLSLAVVSAKLSDFTASSTQFNFEFFKLAYNPAENAILSPTSLHTSLAMFYHVAGEETTPAMREHLHLPEDKTVAATNLHKFLASTRSNRSESLRMLSKVYHVDAELNPELLPLFRDQFGAEVEVADFHDVDAVVQSANSWADRATGGLIREFMEPGDLRVDDELMLLNVVALNASWNQPFDVEDTEPSEFYFSNGVRNVEMMSLDGEFPFAISHEYSCYAVELAYENDTDLAMVVILPMKKSSLARLVPELSLEMYQKLDDMFETSRVSLALPKFTMRKKVDAKLLLMQMGLKPLFTKLDLSIVKRDKSRIGEVRQTAFIKVDEHGTEGAAVTEVQTVGRSGYPSFYANRPFLYLIRKRTTKDIIFIGHLSVHEEQ